MQTLSDSLVAHEHENIVAKCYVLEPKLLETGCPLVMEFRRPFSRPGKSWKIAKVMESHGK